MHVADADGGITAIIPVFNDHQYLPAALESVMRQVTPVKQVIVVDDGSDDPVATRDVVRECARHHGTEIKLIRQSNGGPSSARNAALRMANTEYVAFLDADDQWSPEFLSSKLALLRSRGNRSYVGILGAYRASDGQNPVWPDVDGVMPPGKIGRDFPGGVPYYLLRREALVALGGFDAALRYGEDAHLLMRLSQAGGQFLGCAEATYLLNLRPDSMTRRNPRWTFEGEELFLERAFSESLLSKAEVAFRRFRIRLWLAKRVLRREGDLFGACRLVLAAWGCLFGMRPSLGRFQR